MQKERAPRNRTLTLSEEEYILYRERVINIAGKTTIDYLLNKTINGDLMEILDYLPEKFVDLLVIDPPYNLNKDFNGNTFKEKDHLEYIKYVESWFIRLLPILKDNASIYICCDWKSSAAIFEVLEKYVTIRNRITWQREKGRGALSNWKNCVEDIWFATVGKEYYFDVESVKMKRKVIAPYKENGQPKDWQDTEDGKFRITYPSNFWDDISIPYWSMAENTDHPTQKPEKLIAKLILASSPPNGIVLDPFLGSGTTSVVAKKLGRKYIGIEINEEYCIWAEKRIDIANINKEIQGYTNKIFWERNTLADQNNEKKKNEDTESISLFGD
jgi:site-specific DNA-methyltransferase (adenine-specific)